MKRDPGIDTLLDLDGEILDQGDGYWVKIEAKRVAATVDIPHGIRYSLTLHDASGTRLLGYDNAHAVRPARRFRFAGRRLLSDHRHRDPADKGVPYEFTDAHQLMNDFFVDVDRALQGLRKR